MFEAEMFNQIHDHRTKQPEISNHFLCCHRCSTLAGKIGQLCDVALSLRPFVYSQVFVTMVGVFFHGDKFIQEQLLLALMCQEPFSIL